ncbi:GNAT family N-acetyltransferase [Glycomyces harbinensis]|uniref:Protein N-acetyltransferase, RimJ/RimL family n=1 Tax=Glycomyces harbinensis TaxID=58114 RepID=A0A1G7BZ12_9ACTN|nr:GNAT family N-acetyltransferase [Glycomyces harbinensis]SDE31445.1 Protein N-acetyltransferase, RimJ/RimL family [Glycomyces harbinensis]
MHEALTDGTVTLVPLGRADFDAHFAGEDEQLARWLSGGPSTPEGLRDYLERCERWWEAGGPFHNFGIRTGAMLTLAGTVDVQVGMPYLAPGQVNLAYGLYPQWRGRGLATRAVELACDYAAGLGCAEAVIRCAPENRRSAAVAERAGFTFSQRRSEPDGTVLDWHTRALHPAAAR